MSNYTFSTINDKEFELLVLDLLNAKLNLNLQAFKVGPDQGVDLRYSSAENNNQIVVQAKHYIGSGYPKLKKTFLKEELEKLKALNPHRYIIATSLPLSAKQKDELKELLAPYILSSNDVIGQNDLNTYLREFPEVEKKQFKLWFSSVSMLNAILNNAIEGRTRAYLERLKSKIGLYVVTKNLDKANKLLDTQKLLLVTGQPGLGKTTLADAILLERAKNGFQIYKVFDIREAEDVISPDDETKQLFYFDDFLGETYYEILSAGQAESQITQFVDRIRATPNKYLMLTTRTVILNQADDKSEKINRSQLLNQQYEIQLSDYSKFEKAEILYNHLYFYKVRKDLFNCIIQDKFYRRVIDHENYTPRTIEFLTDPAKIEGLTPQEYREYITISLNNPSEIWSRSFRNQVNYFDQRLLITLFTFRGEVKEVDLAKAYEARLQYEKVTHNQIIKADQFRLSAKILLNGFIAVTLDAKNSERIYSFINPSLTDFFKGYVKDSFQERKAIITSVIYLEQLRHFDPERASIPFENELQTIIQQKIIKNELDSLSEYRQYQIQGAILQTIRKYGQDIDIDQLFIRKMEELDFTNSWWIREQLIYCLLHHKNSEGITTYVKLNFEKLVGVLIKSLDEPDMAKKLPEIFETYAEDYASFTEDDENKEALSQMILKSANYNYRIQKNVLEGRALNLIEVDAAFFRIYQADEELKKALLPEIDVDIPFQRQIDREFWETKIKRNNLLQKEKVKNTKKLRYYYRNTKLTAKTEENAIDDLFYKTDFTKAIQDTPNKFSEPPF